MNLFTELAGKIAGPALFFLSNVHEIDVGMLFDDRKVTNKKVNLCSQAIR